MDRGAWQAAVHRTAQSQTQLKRLAATAAKQWERLAYKVPIALS